MNTVRINAYAKVNLTLEIVGEKDGYHLLDSLVASVDIADSLVISKRKDALSTVIMHGLGSESIPPEKNNAWKAAEAFSKAFGKEEAIEPLKAQAQACLKKERIAGNRKFEEILLSRI